MLAERIKINRMASRGTTPGAKGRASPKKQNTQKQADIGNGSPKSPSANNGVNLNERDVEMEHLKTTLVAINE